MKINLLLGYRFKIFAMVLALFSIAGILMQVQPQWSRVALLFALFIMIFSTEKYENEKIAALRDNVLKMSFIIMFSVIFAQFVVGVVNSAFIYTPDSIFTILLLVSVFHLAVFYIRLFGNRKEYMS